MRGWLPFVSCGVLACAVELPEVQPPPDGTGGEGNAPETIIYVSPLGNDAEDGRSRATAKRTIGAALQAVRADPSLTAVRVCAGEYAEADLVLDQPVSLRGGYECASWTRSQQHGYPSFDGVNETTVQGATTSAAITVTGDTIARSVLIDGFTWRAGDSDVELGYPAAVLVTNGAAPTLTDNRVLGGGGTHGSTALSIVSASPDVFYNDIHGGSAVHPEYTASLGIYVVDGEPAIHQNSIHGGSGVGAIGSAGIIVDGGVMRGDSALSDNLVVGGTGPAPTVGVWIGSGLVEVLGNDIRGGEDVTSYSVACSVGAAGTYVARNRIYGGTTSNGAYGADLNGDDIVFENNWVHAGADSPSGQAQLLEAIRILGDRITVRHNDLVSIRLGAPSSAHAIDIFDSARQATIENNIFVHDSASVSLVLQNCPTEGAVQSFRNNAFFTLARMSYGDVDTPCGDNAQFYPDPLQIENELALRCKDMTPGCAPFDGVVVGGNVLLRNDCTNLTSCIVVPSCDTPSNCAATIFQSWTSADAGRTEIFRSGWLLSPAAPCAVAQSTLFLGDVTVDGKGATRSNPSSMGAHELDRGCAP